MGGHMHACEQAVGSVSRQWVVHGQQVHAHEW